jgi:hypothetical protein
MNKNPLMQKVNFFVSIAFIAVFGFFLTIKIEQAIQLLNPISADAAAMTEN